MDDLTRRAERALLGAMIAAPWLMIWVRVRPGEFADPWHKAVFEGVVAGRALLGRSRDTQEWRQAIVDAATVVTPADLDDLVADCPVPGHGISYAGMVIDSWAARTVTETAGTIFARARLLESDSRQVMRFAMREGLEATAAARHMEDVASAMQAHAAALGRVPPSMDLIADNQSPQQAQREETVLAGLLTQPADQAREILSGLEAAAIRDPYRRAMFATICDMLAAGVAVDPLTVDWELSSRDLPLVRQRGQAEESYATRLARSGTGEQAIPAARELGVEYEQSRNAARLTGPASARRARVKRPELQAGRAERPALRLIRPPEADGPKPGPQQGR